MGHPSPEPVSRTAPPVRMMPTCKVTSAVKIKLAGFTVVAYCFACLFHASTSRLPTPFPAAAVPIGANRRITQHYCCVKERGQDSRSGSSNDPRKWSAERCRTRRTVKTYPCRNTSSSGPFSRIRATRGSRTSQGSKFTAWPRQTDQSICDY